jgi:hypothetical protein
VSFDIFVPVSPPRRRLASSADWYTWSPELLRFCRKHRSALRTVPIQKIRVPRCTPYGITYSRDGDDSVEIGEGLRRFAAALQRFPVASRAIFFRRMIRGPLDRETLHGLFAGLRSAMVELAGDPRAALHSPVSRVRASENEFQLHADLFVSERLLLLFDDVPNDGSGATLLLSRRRLLAGLRAMTPERVRARIARCLTSTLRADAFKRLFDLLHGPHPWRDALADFFDRAAERIELARGEGYLLHDRYWLHGREAVSGEVGTFRFHRLTYSPRQVTRVSGRRRDLP